MSKYIDESCLIVRNFPHSYSERDIYDFLRMFDPIDVNVFIDHRMAFVVFESNEHARDILTLLHQEAVDECRLFVEYAPKNRSNMMTSFADRNTPASTGMPTSEHSPDIVEKLKRLYATAENLNINQPPPPNLCYEYPKVNRDIIDAISIALECMPKFYVQVLHLMNRMNLEPPFVPGDKHLVYASSSDTIQYAVASTQTNEIMWQHSIQNKRKLVESDESELESNSSDEFVKDSAELNLSKSKRKKLKTKDAQADSNRQEQTTQKQRNLLKMQLIQKRLECVDKPQTTQSNAQKISDAFESNQLKISNIKIVVPDQLNVSCREETPTTEPIHIGSEASRAAEDSEMADSFHISEFELNDNRIPPEQLKVHPMFQNYSPGEISNRLYIKNIAKEVTEADLHAIYDRYLEVNSNGQGHIRSIDIRLMTSGRMKGQAFITFDGPYLNCDVDIEANNHLSNKYQMIEKALNETNGLILKGKPLVVVYGKKK